MSEYCLTMIIFSDRVPLGEFHSFVCINRHNIDVLDVHKNCLLFWYSAFAQYNMDQFTIAKIDGYDDQASF